MSTATAVETTATPAIGTRLLDVEDVVVRINGTEILHGASFTLDAGELLAIVGPNGAGKSTLTRAAAGLQRFQSGSVRWSGEDVRQLRGRKLARRRAFVPQRGRVPTGMTVREAVRLGRAPHIGPLQRATRRDHEAVDRAMARTGVTEFADRDLSTLSGGELQRVQIAVGLAQEAPVLIADEPTSHLDLGAAVAVARLLRALADDGLAVVLVAHDLSLAAAVADTPVVISDGRSVASGPPSEVLHADRLAHVWRVDAALATGPDGRTALQVAWLDETADARLRSRAGGEAART
jgi:iron complex transport system ATP-binding protein